MKNFLEERRSGFFLLFFAFFVITTISLGHQAESKDLSNFSDDSQSLDEGEKSYELVSEISQGEVIEAPFGEIKKEEESVATKEEDVANVEVDAKAIAKIEAEKYAELKDNLKKYCDKKYNSKKCKKYLSEAKALSSAGKEYKKIYDKYLEKKEDREDDSDDSKSTEISPDEKALTIDFVVKSNEGEKKFEIQFVEGETVYEVMKRAKEQGKISYEKNTDETYGVYINTINGLEEGSAADWTQNKYWILFVSGKSSNLGCSSHKLDKTDTSIEWKYEKYVF